MAETRDQGLVELNKQFEDIRVNSLPVAEDRARHFEEQRLHSQNMEKQILEMKEILISMAARHRVQASSSKDPAQNSPSTPVSQFHSTRCERIAVKKLPDQVAHQVFDETPKSENTIENDGAESMEQEESNRGESSEDGDEGLIEDVLKIDVALEQDLAAHQVLDKMPELLADKIDLEIAHVSSIEELHDLEAFGDDVRAQVVWALGNIVGDSPQCCDLARQSGELMPHLTQINGQIFDVISVCAGMFNFDPGGRELRNLAEPFLHRFHFVRSSLLKFVVLKEISCLVLCSLDDTQLLVDANNESLIFDPGGEEFVFDYLNLLRLNTVQNVKDVCSNLMSFDPGGNGLTYSVEISINEARIQHTYKGARAAT